MSSVASASSSKPTLSRPQSSRSRRKTAENWDDDFEFALPARQRPASARAQIETTALSKPSALVPSDPHAASTSKEGRASTPESPSSWSDQSPPRSPTVVVARRTKASHLTPLNIASSPPRASQSRTSGLPTPEPRSASTSASDSFTLPNQPLLPHPDAPPIPNYRQSPASGSALREHNKLIKRHPSATFTPMTDPDSSLTSLSSQNPSSSHLRHAPSTEQMPPPPLPPGAQPASMAGGNTGRRPGSRGDGQIRVSNIPFSPSQDDMRSERKKKGIWKQLSDVSPEASDGCEPTFLCRVRL